MTFSYHIGGTDGRGITWTTEGTVIIRPDPRDDPYQVALPLARRASFDQLTGGKAVFGQPGRGCCGPYRVDTVTLRQLKD